METNHVAAIRRAVKNNFNDLCFVDGHTIYSPGMYTKAGIPKEVIDPLDQEFKSDGSPKGIIKDCSGVAHLDFLRMVADVFKADTREADSKFGRGSEAAELVSAIKKVM